uniref:Uncharacterized protein n=1 Tax=Pyrodinium bahamense TaxID=73915 RepID=A0A7S0B3F0_9DINO
MAAARACADGVSGGAGLRRSYSGVSGGSAHSVPEEAHEVVKATRRGALKELKERKTSTSHASDASGASMKRGASFMSAASSGALYVSEEQTVPEVTPTQKLAGASAGSGGASPSPPEVIPTQKPAGASLNRGASFASAGSSSVANPSQEQTVVEVSAPQQLSGTSATVASSGGEPAELAEPAEVSALQQPSDAAASAGGEPVEPPEVSAVQQPPGTSASAGDEPAEPAVATEV